MENENDLETIIEELADALRIIHNAASLPGALLRSDVVRELTSKALSRVNSIGRNDLTPTLRRITPFTYATIAEASLRLGVSPSRVHQYINEGRLEGAIRYGGERRGLWLIPRRSIDGFQRRKRGRRKRPY